MAATWIRDDIRALSGSERAAALLLSLGEDNAARILAHMNDDEIKELSQVMSSLGNLSSNLVENLFMEFAEQMSSISSMSGTIESTERLLSKVLDKSRVGSIMEDIRGTSGHNMWDKIANINEALLANFLKNEHPQTVAVVLSKIKADQSAKVLSQLPAAFAIEVVGRVLRMGAVQKDVLDDVERTLRSEFMNNVTRTNSRDPHESMAEIFNHLDRASEARFLDELDKCNHDSAEKIRSLMFTFEDLIKLDTSAIQAILRAVDKSKLPIALKGASEVIRDLFFSNMSERASRLLQEEIQSLKPQRLRDVEEAQNSIVGVAKGLAANGEISIVKETEEDQLVY